MMIVHLRHRVSICGCCLLLQLFNELFFTKNECRTLQDIYKVSFSYVLLIILSLCDDVWLQVFDIDSGSLRFTFGSAGEGNGQFGAPTGVAVDKQGNILVADWGNSRIQVS